MIKITYPEMLLAISALWIAVRAFFAVKNKKFEITKFWWAQVDSNHRPHAYQACALTC